jgi:hypothetical protein
VTCQPATATKMAADRLVVSRLGSHVNDPAIRVGGWREWASGEAVGGATHSKTATDVGHAAPMFWRRSKRRKIFSPLTLDEANKVRFISFIQSCAMTGIRFASNIQMATSASSLSHTNSFAFPSRWPNAFDKKRNI